MKLRKYLVLLSLASYEKKHDEIFCLARGLTRIFHTDRNEAPRILMQTRKMMDYDDGSMFHTARGTIRS
jgi:hypothetical protein